MRRGAISTRSVLGDRHKHHLFLPSRQCSGDQGTFNRFPSAADYRGGMSLRSDEIRRRRKRHSSIEFLVDRVYVFRGFVRRQNWDVRHMTNRPLSQTSAVVGFHEAAGSVYKNVKSMRPCTYDFKCSLSPLMLILEPWDPIARDTLSRYWSKLAISYSRAEYRG